MIAHNIIEQGLIIVHKYYHLLLISGQDSILPENTL